jgi:hypothetical protein
VWLPWREQQHVFLQVRRRLFNGYTRHPSSPKSGSKLEALL